MKWNFKNMTQIRHDQVRIQGRVLLTTIMKFRNPSNVKGPSVASKGSYEQRI